MAAAVIAVEARPDVSEPISLPGTSRSPVTTGAPALVHERFSAFSRTFGIIVACELWSEVARFEGMWHAARLAVAIIFTLCAAGIWTRRLPRLAAAVASISLLVRLACFFPLSANHHYLEVLYAFFLAIPDRNPEEENLVLKAVCATVIVGLIASGIQKVLHGYYFRGEFLCFMLAHDARFDVLKHLVPASEYIRLQALDKGIGAGPYRVDSVPLLVVSNMTYLLEILVPVGLLVSRLRPLALLTGIAFVVSIEIAARELFFGALMINSLLLFSPGAIHRKALPFFAAFCLYLLAVSLGLLPTWRFT